MEYLRQTRGKLNELQAMNSLEESLAHATGSEFFKS